MTNRRVLVVGCREGSLGQAIADEAERQPQGSSLFGAPVWRADREENPSGAWIECDVEDRKSIVTALEGTEPTDIVCCVGINMPDGEPHVMVRHLSLQLQTNVWGPMQLLSEALDYWHRHGNPPHLRSGFNFVAVSSNSAHIARTQSTGYCASKAALSMALRCQARELARKRPYVHVWGYEPGWIGGTPMSEEVIARMHGGIPSDDDEVLLHRIPGGMGLNKYRLAKQIVHDLAETNYALNGCMVRIDGGEQ